MATASPNLAFIKYWGKKNFEQNLPANNSFSISLDNLKTETKIFESNRDVFILNEVETEIPERMYWLIDDFRKMSGGFKKVKIVSTNNFPQSCGLASSASGYAALVMAMNDFFNLKLTDQQLSAQARKGSGSASRSIYKGLVLFENQSSRKIGEWPELKVFVIFLDVQVKKISSSKGMMRTARTSYFYQKRLEHVEEKIKNILEAVEKRDFEATAEMIMDDSNEFHAICMDTYPPIRYINDRGFDIINKVHLFNENGIKAAYSFDAGTNPFIITLEKYVDELKEFFVGVELFTCN